MEVDAGPLRGGSCQQLLSGSSSLISHSVSSLVLLFDPIDGLSLIACRCACGQIWLPHPSMTLQLMLTLQYSSLSDQVHSVYLPGQRFERVVRIGAWLSIGFKPTVHFWLQRL